MSCIQKFKIPAVDGIETVEMPENSEIFAVLQDGNDIALFATCERERDNEVRSFLLIRTDEDLPAERTYLGSVSFLHAFNKSGVGTVRDTPFELHVFELAPEVTS